MKTLYIAIIGMLFGVFAKPALAQDQCVTGNAVAQNIQYKVNGKIVSSLKNNVPAGALVEVTFTTEAGKSATKFALVSYMAANSNRSAADMDKLQVYDYETEEVLPGLHRFEIFVPAGYFEVDFVKGCPIFAMSKDKNYDKEGRTISYANGGSKENQGQRKVTICHIPKGNPANAHTITVAEAAAKAHIGRHGGDYYGECRTATDTGSVMVDVTCTTVVATSTSVNINTITLLLDDSSTQEFTINAKTAIVSPINEFEGYFIAGAWVKLDGESGEGTFYANEDLAYCDTARPPLPVKLIKFEAKKIESNVVQLNWVTAQEINNDYIAIEKSADIENWKEVCRVPGHGTSDHVHDYSCTDHNADEYGQNNVYYRPKQVDYNGTFEYFNTIKVRLQDAAYAAKVENVYPNPATDRLNIKYNSSENGIFNIRLISMDGKALLQNQFVAKPGTQVVDINLLENQLDPGFYVLEIQSDTEVFRQKVYKQ